LDEVAQKMLDNDVSALVVLDERPNLCGIVSKTDLIGFYSYESFYISSWPMRFVKKTFYVNVKRKGKHDRLSYRA